MLRVLVVDDEALARDRLSRMINKLAEYEVIAEAANGKQAIHSCQENNPDIVLMDIRMPGMDGLAAARQLAQLDQAPALIFCTAYGEYALDAFDVNAVGYLLKPVKKEKLLAALISAQRLTKPQLQSLNQEDSAARPSRHHLHASHQGAVQLIAIDEIRVLFADHKYVTVYHSDGDALIEESLKSLEDEFNTAFVRVHRNSLVAIKQIDALERMSDGSYCVKVKGCEFKPQVSRRHVTALRKLMQSL